MGCFKSTKSLSNPALGSHLMRFCVSKSYIIAIRRSHSQTEGNSSIRVAKLMNYNLNAQNIVKLTMETPEYIRDVTADLK